MLKNASDSIEGVKTRLKSKKLTPAVFIAVGLLFSLFVPVWTAVALAAAVFYCWYKREDGDSNDA